MVSKTRLSTYTETRQLSWIWIVHYRMILELIMNLDRDVV